MKIAAKPLLGVRARRRAAVAEALDAALGNEQVTRARVEQLEQAYSAQAQAITDLQRRADALRVELSTVSFDCHRAWQRGWLARLKWLVTGR